MNALRLSVALCTYNGESFLPEQLRSIAAQTRLPYELVVCDDCSTDGTASILQDFARKASFSVRLLANSHNLGSTKSFERAICECTGDVIVLSDQDDSWYDDRLQVTENAFIRQPDIGALFGDADLVDKNLGPLGYRLRKTTYFEPALRQQFKNGEAFKALLAHNVVTGATMAFRSSFRNLVIPIPAQWIHDGWIAILIAAVANVAYLDRPLIQYRQHSSQQLGATKRSVRRHYANTQAPWNRKKYKDMPEQYRLVDERLKVASQFERSPEIGELLQKKISHMTRRAGLSVNPIWRVPTIAKELALNRYRRFGYGWKGAVRDLLVKLNP